MLWLRLLTWAGVVATSLALDREIALASVHNIVDADAFALALDISDVDGVVIALSVGVGGEDVVVVCVVCLGCLRG